ncbi:MAG: hypothetical protein ACK4J0_01045 [Candidatus Anstonellaceae archaeon]
MNLPFYLSQAFSTEGWLAWSNNIALIGLVALFVLILLHMIAILFNYDRLKNWVKGEYFQVFATFFLALLLAKAMPLGWAMMLEITKQIYFSNPVLKSQIPNFQNVFFDPFEFSQTLLKDAYLGCQQTLFKYLFVINYFFKVIASQNVAPQGSEPLGSWYSSIYSSTMEYLMQRLTYGMFFNWIQITLLGVIKYVAPLLIQLGLIFRVIPYTRGFGGFLLASGVGFFVVYPLSIILLLTFQPPGAACSSFVPPPLMEQALEESQPSPELYDKAKFFISANQEEIDEKISTIESYVTMLYLQGMIFPFVSLTIVFTFIRQTSNILGADLNEIGRGLLKLI